MSDTYNAGKIELSTGIELSGFRRDLRALNKEILKAGQKSGEDLKKNFTNYFDSNLFGSEVKSGITDGLDAALDSKMSGDKAGKEFVSGFQIGSKNIGKNLGSAISGAVGGALKGGLVGVALAGINFAINKIAQSSREAKQELAALNARLAEYREIVESSNEFLAKFNGLNIENIDLLGVAEGRVSAVTGEYISLLDELNSRSSRLIEPQIKIDSEALINANKDVDVLSEKLAKLRKGKTRYSHTAGISRTTYDYKEIEKTEGLLKDAQEIADTLQANIDKNSTSLETLKSANEDLLKKRQDQFSDERKMAAYRADQNDKEIRDLREKQEIERLTHEYRKLYDYGEKKAREEAEADVKNVWKLEDDKELERKAAERKRIREQEQAEEKRHAEITRQKQEQINQAAKAALEKKVNEAKALFKEAETPIEKYKARLNSLALIEQNFAADAGGSQTFYRLRSKALIDLAKSTQDYEGAIAELIRLQQSGLISADQFGQAFQDLTDPIEGAADALERLQKLSAQGLIGAGTVTAANSAITSSDDYNDDLEDNRKEGLRLAVVDLEKEAAKLEKDLILAELAKEDDTVSDLERRLAVIAETIAQLNAGVDPEQALKNAEEFVKKEEEFENQKDLAKLKGDVRDMFESGIKSAIDGDFEDFLASKLQGAADSMFDNAIDTLLDSLLKEGGPLEGLISSLFGGEGGGGLDGIFGSLFGGSGGATDEATSALGGFSSELTAAQGGLGQFGGALGAFAGLSGGLTELLGGDGKIGALFGLIPGLFAGFFADGGVVPRGQFAIVGEQGPEVISAGASPLRVTPMNDNYAASRAAQLTPDGGGVRAMSYAPVNNFYGHTQDDLRRSLDDRDRALKAEMPGMMDRHSFNRNRGMG